MTTTSAESGSLGTAHPAGINSPSSTQIVGKIGPASGNVAIATNPKTGANPELPKTATTNQLWQAAVAEAARVDEVSDEAAWGLMELMLRLRESFVSPAGKLNEKAFEAFLVDHGAKPHGNVKNPAQRLAKVCCPNADRDRLSKYGCALAAMIKRKIHSSAVKVELEKREAVLPKGPLHYGVNRFVLLHRQVDTEPTKPKKAVTGSSNRYMAFETDRLKKEAVLILLALKGKGLLPPEHEALSAALGVTAKAA